jgi:diguanylate cyclase (GGDEF)-like protein
MGTLKRLIPALALLLGCSWVDSRAAPATLTSLRAAHALSNAEASQELPALFEATVTYYRNDDTDLLVQDGGDAIYVNYKPGAGLAAGDRVLVTGKTHDSFRPMINGESVKFLHHGIPPAPLSAGFEQLNSAELDCKRVTLRAVVRSADIVGTPDLREIYLQTVMPGGYVDVAVNSTDASVLKGLLDAEVQITGVATAKFDERMELAGSRIDVQQLGDLKVIHPSSTPADLVPFTPMEDVYANYRVTDDSRRVRIRGTLTYFQPGSTVVIQNGSKSMWVRTRTSQHLTIGDLVEVSGFPELRNEYPTLSMAEVRDAGIKAPVAPLRVNWDELVFGGNAFKLVTTEGRLVRQVREPALDEYVLEAQGHLFSAVYRHPADDSKRTSPPLARLPLGAKIGVTGIGMFYTPDPFNGPVASSIQLRSDADIVVLDGPPLLNMRNLLLVAAGLVVIVCVFAARGLALERKVRRETAIWATVERWRSGVLEDINRARPIAEIIVRITGLLSFKLQGTPCWCQLAGGETLGNCPADRAASRLLVIRHEIPSHSGAALGTIFAGIDPRSKLRETGPDALFNAAQLVALAIETGGLYSDLVHRSEFDLLTDTHNRFSLEQRLDKLLESTRRQDAIFGLIYIDLDDFKQVNDSYGHRIGDLYLQEVAVRMKRQLRPGDMLARLGGDEFAIVVPAVRSRIDVEEITYRLERSFDDPFELEGNSLRGTASVGIAVYPEDGSTRDTLLGAADAAMYRAKNARRQASEEAARERA